PAARAAERRTAAGGAVPPVLPRRGQVRGRGPGGRRAEARWGGRGRRRSRVTPGSYPGSLRGGMARAAGGAIRLRSVGERRRHGRAMATETPGPAGGDGGAGPQEAAHRAGGGARLGRTLYAVLWQAPAELPRLLPAAPERPVPRPLLGGVFADAAARSGRPVGRLRLLAALTVVPLLLYPVLWAVHASGRPDATGRAAANRRLILS